MKLIAHRGASLSCPENSLISLVHAAKLGADAVECDIRLSADHVPLIYHDATLERLTGQPLPLAETSYDQIRKALAAAGKDLVTLTDLLAEPDIHTDILLHLKNDPIPNVVLDQLRPAAGRILCGVSSLDALAQARSFMPDDRILAFVDHWRNVEAFIQKGAGIIRLWEQWLDTMRPADVKAIGPVEVWIMSMQNGSMNGSATSLQHLSDLGADGVLLNDIEMALAWRQVHLQHH